MLKGKTAIVTGATKGIGKAIAQLFADQGAVVYGLGRNQEDLNKLNEYADNMHPVLADVCSSNQCKEIFSTIYKEEGRIDILVNNAGIMQDALIGMITDSQIQTLFQTNVYKEVIRIHQMCGSTAKGELRQHIYKNGQYYDITIMSILREEWKQTEKKRKYETIEFDTQC